MLWPGRKVSSRLLSVSILAILLLLQGCTEKTSATISQTQLKSMIADSFLSPQIRNLDLIPAVGVQLYLETPEVTIESDHQPLSFRFTGYVDADFLGSTVTERLPLAISGSANFLYDGKERSFYFHEIELSEARIDMDVAIFETLIMERLKKALVDEIGNLAIIHLEETSPLLKEIDDRSVSISVSGGGLLLSYEPKVSPQ